MAQAALIPGTVKKITDKNFGFIEGPDGQHYFFHASALQQAAFSTLSLGDPVRFVPGQGERGPRAERVEVV